MQKNNKPPNQILVKIGGWCAILSGVFFFIVTFYIFGVLINLGLDPDMFDDHTLLHPWVAENLQLYQFSWLFYFLTQLFLLPVPPAMANYFQSDKETHTALAQLSKTLGTVSITLAILGPSIFYAITPITAEAYVAFQNDPTSKELVLVISELMADIPKDIRLFSELILGLWLGILGYLLLKVGQARRLGGFVLGVGIWTFIIVTWKIFDPLSPLEDFLGLLLAIAYISIGVHLLQQS